MRPLSSFLASLLCLGLGLGQTSLAEKAKGVAQSPGSKGKNPAPTKPAGPGENPGMHADITVLLDFKKKVQKDPTGCLTNWITTTEIDKWKGIVTQAAPGTNLPRIVNVILDGCGLEGPGLHLDGILNKLPFLTVFGAYGNSFTGDVPLDIGVDKMKYFYELDLSLNQLEGPEFPRGVLNANLTFLDLRFNNFKGTLPDELFSASNSKVSTLDVIYLNDNRFSGQLPANIGQCRAGYLSLSGNQLSGPIPSDFGSMPNAKEVWIYDNQLSGELPDSISNLRLGKFDASSNMLSGPLPWSFGRLEHVSYFNVSNNKLKGPIPDTWGGMKSALKLDLSNNLLSGPIPQSLCQISVLRRLNLQGNCFDLTKLPPACKNLQAKGKANLTNRKGC